MARAEGITRKMVNGLKDNECICETCMKVQKTRKSFNCEVKGCKGDTFTKKEFNDLMDVVENPNQKFIPFDDVVKGRKL